MREYGIKPSESLTEYSEDQIQTMLSQLPTERIVKFTSGMSKIEMENKYLESFMDRDTSHMVSMEQKYMLFEKRAILKVKLKEKLTEEERVQLVKEYEEVTLEIGDNKKL